jgi:hypothetical protein
MGLGDQRHTQPLNPRGRDLYIVQEAGWSDMNRCAARSELLYRLSYTGLLRREDNIKIDINGISWGALAFVHLV